MEQSEVEKLFEVTQEPNVLEQPLNPQPEEGEDKKDVVVDDELGEAKRRRERRLMEKLQEEREANIAMAARLEAMAEARRLHEDTEPSEYLKKVERIYGTESPEAKAATELLSEALQGVEERAMNRALERFREEQSKAREDEAKEERKLASYVDHIEDTYNVNLTPELQRSYFQLMEKLSPKDSNGNVIEYADPDTTWEIFQEKLNKSKDNPAKSMASRTMAQGGVSNETTLQDDAARSLLREAGII